MFKEMREALLREIELSTKVLKEVDTFDGRAHLSITLYTIKIN